MSTKLFVDPEEDEDEQLLDTKPSPSVNQMYISSEEPEDDPIISEIPIILKKTESNQKLHILQYPGRPETRPFVNETRVVESRLKPQSNLIEVDIPIDTTKFYDNFKSEEWGGVNRQTLTGVLLELEGYYTANMKEGELILIPLDSTAQLRPNLKHIDKVIADKKELHKLENPNTSGLQVVHMTVKNSSDNAPRLGGALLARKKVDEEKFEILKCFDLNDEETQQIREKVIHVNNREFLQSKVTNQEYIASLVKDTVV